LKKRRERKSRTGWRNRTQSKDGDEEKQRCGVEEER